MNKITKQSFMQIGALTLIMFLIFSCNSNDKPANFDYGKIEDNSYINNYFKFEIKLPKDWVVSSREQLDIMTDKGKKIIAGDNSNLKAIINASDIKTDILMSIYEYERGAAVEFNPNLTIVAENVTDYPGIKTGYEYLYQSRKQLNQFAFKYDYIDSIFNKEIINNFEFYTMNTSVNNVKQTYYTTIINRFSVNFIVTYNNDLNKEKLLKILNSIKEN